MEPSTPVHQSNADSLRALTQLVARLTPSELDGELYDGWTIGVALAHLAFWDRCAAVACTAWRTHGFHDAAWFTSGDQSRHERVRLEQR